MNSLLDKFKPQSFQPKTPTDVFALRLAQKLGDARVVSHYANLAERYSEFQLLCAFRRTLRATTNGDRGRRFLSELLRVQESGCHSPSTRLVAIRVERRAVAAAIFDGEHLEYTDSRQLSSSSDKALSSANGFLQWLLMHFAIESAALEAIPNGHEIQRRLLHDGLSEVLRERMLPIWEIPRTVLLEACGEPPLKTREELRQVATTLWPVIAGSHAKVFIQDAAILGLHVQIERLFITNN